MRFRGWLLVVCALVGCGDDDSGGGGQRDARVDTNGTDTNAASDAAIDSPAATCLPGTYDVDSVWPFGPQSLAITGTITLPGTLMSGRAVQLETIKTTQTTGNYLKPATVSGDKTTIAYRTGALPDGSYKICLRADVDGNGSVGDVGTDYIGCFNGTVNAPIKTSGGATIIALGGACQSGKDFGLGVQ